MRICLFVFMLAFASVLFVPPVCAEEGADVQETSLAEAQAKALRSETSSLMKELDQGEMTHFNIIYTNYSIYSLVKSVREDVENAVKQCIENNPDMKNKLSDRWDIWDKSVSTNMKEALANIDAMVGAQDYAPRDKMQTIFSLIDETRKKDISRFRTIPATTPEACEYMISKMDETQNQMNMMLVVSMKTYSAVMKSMQE